MTCLLFACDTLFPLISYAHDDSYSLISFHFSRSIAINSSPHAQLLSRSMQQLSQAQAVARDIDQILIRFEMCVLMYARVRVEKAKKELGGLASSQQQGQVD